MSDIAFFAIAGIAGYFMYQQSKPEMVRLTETVKRDVLDGGSMLIDTFRGIGHVLTTTGRDIGELLHIQSEPMSMSQLKQKYNNKFKLNEHVLNEQYIEGMTRSVSRSEFVAPTGEINYPLPFMLSTGWYE